MSGLQIYLQPLFYDTGLLGHFVETIQNIVIGLTGNVGKVAAPLLLRKLITLLKSLAHLVDLAGIAAGKSRSEILNSLGGLGNAPVAVFRDVGLCLQFGSGIYGEITAG